jgi:hypothetical protein
LESFEKILQNGGFRGSKLGKQAGQPGQA